MNMKRLNTLLALPLVAAVSLAILSGCVSTKAAGSGSVYKNGAQVASIASGEQADKSGAGLGKANWNLFGSDKELLVSIGASYDNATDSYYLSFISLRNIPGIQIITIDGPVSQGQGTYSYSDYSIKLNDFSFAPDFSSLEADITIVSDAEIRICYSGPTPNDGKVYLAD